MAIVGRRIFRKTDPDQVVLYMYRNTPSVIIGRNQASCCTPHLQTFAFPANPTLRTSSGSPHSSSHSLRTHGRRSTYTNSVKLASPSCDG